MKFSEALKNIRLKYDSGSAKKAWLEWKRSGLSINYSYYMKIENGDVLPSIEIVNQLKRVLSKEESLILVQAYSSELFPELRSVFNLNKKKTMSSPPPAPKKSSKKNQTINQYVLTESQVSLLASQKNLYFIFLTLILARKPILLSELQFISEREDYRQKLEKLNMTISDKNGIRMINSEIKFPPRSPRLSSAYDQFEKWENEFAQEYQFHRDFKKRIFRRISAQYLDVITQQLNMLIDLIKLSEESDDGLNDNVILLDISLENGSIPG